MTHNPPRHLSLHGPAPARLQVEEPAAPLADHRIRLIDGREPMGDAGAHIAGSRSVPRSHLHQAALPGGPLVLLGLILRHTVAPAWILLPWCVGAGLAFAGVSGVCGMARPLALLPWNRGRL